MKFILSKSDLNNWEEKIPVGNYKGLHLRFSGTNDTGQALSSADIGNITFSLNGEQLFFVPSGFLADLNNQMYGYVEESSASGGAFSISLFLPFEIPEFPNGLHINPEDDAYLGLQVGSNVDTKVVSWSIDVNGVLTGDPENYILKSHSANETVTGAVTIKNKLPQENIFSVYVKGSNISRLLLERDGELVHECDYNSALAETSLRTRVESSLVGYVALPCGDQVSDLLSDDVSLQVTTTDADTIYIQLLHVGFDSKRQTKSLSDLNNQVAKRLSPIQRKKPEAVETAKNLKVWRVTKAV
ncbi:MAG: hypothetical protein ACTSVV_14430 [Promethearchaeota archaeon]